ncbi:MAG: ABC transporter substrate-binding protein [Rhodospirillales bacterium]|nr:ABC transporter substrate-binding protein [Rhodospirillales bacterium]
MNPFFSIVKAVALAILVVAAASFPAAAETPSKVVEKFQADLLQVMKDAEKLSVRQRYERLAPTVETSFHLPLMVQIATANHWQDASPSQRVQLVSAFRRMSVTTLATLFDSYDGESFQVLAEKPGPQHTQLVLTKLTKSDKSTVNIAYVARKFEDGWRMIDVIVDDGISELKVRRSEYSSVLKSDGIPGLVALLNRKADELISK